jgi:hypothetical protein
MIEYNEYNTFEGEKDAMRTTIKHNKKRRYYYS